MNNWMFEDDTTFKTILVPIYLNRIDYKIKLSDNRK